jgi:tetratricopeptide repeat protein
MRPTTLLIMVLSAATPASGQNDSMRDLERMCSRIADDPRPANLTAMQVFIDREEGARRSYLTGCRLLAEQKWGQAGNEFEKAIKVAPDVAIYHFWFGRATGEQAQRANPIRQPGLARRVKGEFEKAAALDPTYIAPHEGLLRFYLAAPGFLGGSVDRARGEAEAIMKINSFRGGLAHANVAFAAKDTAGVIRAHEKLIAEYPDSATSYFTLLNVQLVRKQWAAAWAVADKLEQLRPDLAIVRYATGRVAAESGEQLDRGEAALRKYLEHTPQPNEPSLAATHWRLGMIAEKRGDIPAARQAYETATKMDPNLRQAKDALARVKQ